MYYEINVAYKNHHYFATAERSILDEKSAKRLFNIFKQKFPEKE